MVANGAHASIVFGVGNHTWQYLLLVADVLIIHNHSGSHCALLCYRVLLPFTQRMLASSG